MNVMTPDFLSLKRAADTACVASEVLASHPGARIHYPDDQSLEDTLRDLEALETQVADAETMARRQDQRGAGEPPRQRAQAPGPIGQKLI